jgi:hypothetical protein
MTNAGSCPPAQVAPGPASPVCRGRRILVPVQLRRLGHMRSGLASADRRTVPLRIWSRPEKVEVATGAADR